jgi:CubicO group peptidase (beta-lactamase class C family)
MTNLLKFPVLCFAMLVFASFGIAQEQAQVAIEKPGLSPEELSELEAWIEETRQAWDVPGLSVAIVWNDQVIHCKGYGVRQLGSVEAVDKDTLFAIASNSKAFTADALALLVDEGKLRWDDPVHKYLPWLRLSDPLASQDLRVRDLLCHRSGLGTFSGDLLWWGTSYSPREVLERSVHLKPATPFRANYGYSNLMFLAAGEVLSSISGMPWGEFVSQRLLQPLGMSRSRWSVSQLSGMENVATPHKTTLEKTTPIPWMNWDTMAAAGGIISSASDMSKWMRFQLREGTDENGNVILSPKSHYETMQPHTIIPVSKSRSQRVPSTHFRSYALGWSVSDYHGIKLVGHGGGYDGMYSEQMMIPEHRFGVVVLTNSMTPIGDAIAHTVVDRFLKASQRDGASQKDGPSQKDWSEEGFRNFRQGRAEFQNRIAKATARLVQEGQPSHPLESYVGKYRCPLYGDAEVRLIDGQLHFFLLPYPDLHGKLEWMHYDTFAIRWHQTYAWFDTGSVHFVFDAQAQAEQIRLDVPNDDLWFYELQLRRVP